MSLGAREGAAQASATPERAVEPEPVEAGPRARERTATPSAALPRLREPGTTLRLVQPPAVGSCIGGSCATPGATSVLPPQPTDPPPPGRPRSSSATRRARFAYSGGVLGPTLAAALLGGAIAIAMLDHQPSERITRGFWVGTLAVSGPLIALSAYVARKESGYKGVRAVRRLGWFSWGLATSDGVLLWALAFGDLPRSRVLTIGAGGLAALALLPLGLDALSAGRSLRAKRFFMSRVSAGPSGLTVRF